MHRALKWVGFALGALVAVALLAVAVVWIAGGRIVRRTYDVPSGAFTAPRDSAAIAEGQRLATMRGCDGCHGERLEGTVFFNQPLVGRLSASNLTAVVREYSDADLERAIRHGVRPTGRSLFVMPSETFYHLSDADLGAMVAYLRALPSVDNPLPPTRIGLLGRLGLLTGQYVPAAVLVSQEGPRNGDEPATEGAALGRYLALTVCAECHGTDLQGGGFLETPSLSVVAGYDEAAFVKLLRTGIALGDRHTEVMAENARLRFQVMNDREVAALYTFLSTLPAAAAPTAEASGG